jgi:hypothetical protein
VTVNALLFLLNRIKPRRPRMHTSLLTLATLFAAAAVVAAVCLLPRSSDPAQEPTPSRVLSPIAVPAASAVCPGAGIYLEYADGCGEMACTAGC